MTAATWIQPLQLRTRPNNSLVFYSEIKGIQSNHLTMYWD